MAQGVFLLGRPWTGVLFPISLFLPLLILRTPSLPKIDMALTWKRGLPRPLKVEEKQRMVVVLRPPPKIDWKKEREDKREEADEKS